MGSGLEVAPWGWEGRRGWCFHGTGVMGQSWTEIHSGMLSGQGQVAWGGRINFLDGHPDSKPRGREQGWGLWCSWGSGGLSRSLPGSKTKGTHAGCGAEPEAWPSVTSYMPSTLLASLAGWRRGHVPAPPLTSRWGR